MRPRHKMFVLMFELICNPMQREIAEQRAILAMMRGFQLDEAALRFSRGSLGTAKRGSSTSPASGEPLPRPSRLGSARATGVACSCSWCREIAPLD